MTLMSALPSYSETYSEISAAEVQARWERGEAGTLVDVRAAWEYEGRHIPGALLLPLDTLPARFAGALDPASEIICVCEHGVRSEAAARFLAAQGYPHAATMTGGMSAYQGPVESGLPERSR